MRKKKFVKEYVELMLQEQKNDDKERAHQNADTYLCELLSELGYQEVIDAYNEVGKWYA